MKDEAVTGMGRRALAVKTFGITDRGNVRPSNEDQFLIAELTKTMRIGQASLPDTKAQFGDERGHLFLVPIDKFYCVFSRYKNSHIIFG